MHRTVKVSYYGYKVCGSQRDKDKIVAYRSENASYTAKEPSKERTLLGSQFVYIGVLSDDFAAVDVCEDLCKTKPPEKANSEGLLQSDNNSEEIAGKK